MRFPRPRFTVRWLMVAVVAVALACGAWEARRRHRAVIAFSAEYRQRASYYRG